LSVSNSIKVGIKWLKTGDNITKEEVERAVMELEFEHEDELENAQNNKIG